MKIVAISDTHNLHRELTIPECDLLIHAGDATMLGTPKEMKDFFDWFLEQPAKDKFFVPGNHEVGFYHNDYWYWGDDDYRLSDEELSTFVDKKTYINNKLCLYGSPWTTVSPKWGFQFPWYENNAYSDCDWYEHHETKKKTWAAIPEDVNILVTHSPPHGILDGVPPADMKYLKENDPFYAIARLHDSQLGDRILREEIQKRKKLKYHFFGHIHESYGHMKVGKVHYYNVAICDRDYKVFNPITVVEI